MGAEIRHRTTGVRDRILSRLMAEGEITDPGGLASAALLKAVDYRGSSVAFAQLLSGMERDGLIEREVRGKRTYRIRLADGEGKPHRSEAPSGKTASARIGTPALNPAPGPETAPAPGGREFEPEADATAAFDYDELAMRLLAQVVRRIAAPPDEGSLPGEALSVARTLQGSDPGPGEKDLTLALVSLERRLASVQSRQRELSEETAMLREQLAAVQRSLTEIRAGFAGERLDPEERQVLQRLLSSLHAAPARRRSAEAGLPLPLLPADRGTSPARNHDDSLIHMIVAVGATADGYVARRRKWVWVGSQALGWGIVGLGRIAGSQIAPAITASAGSRLACVVSRDQGRAEEFARVHGAAAALDDYAKMLADPAVRAVYIATPNALHAEQVIAAARAGKHVLCDKPLALTAADARQCVEECRSAGVRLGITFQTRYHDGLADAAALVRDGGIGRVTVAEVTMSAGRNLPLGWRTDPALAGLGTLNNIGVHAFDLLRYLLGSEVTEVVALTDAEPGYHVDTTALVLLRFANGTVAYVNANQSVPHSRDDIVLYGSQGRILGRNLSRPAQDGTLSLITPAGEREFPAGSREAYRRVIEAFADAVSAGRDPSPAGEDGVRSVELTTAIAQAIAERRVVSLP